MVKVECQGCQAPYQIDERRIPPTGLKMRCPKCGTSVLVQRPGSATSTPAASDTAPAKPAATPAPPAAALRPPPAPGRPTAPAIPAVPAAPPAAPAAAKPKPPPPAGRGGFGELDLMVDLPNPDAGGGADDDDGGGAIDLPAVGGGGGGAVDLPAVGRAAPGAFGASPRPPGPPPAPAPAGGGGGFGGGGGGFGEIDLPSAAPDHRGGQPFGAVDLPVISPAAPRGGFGDLPPFSPSQSSGVDLPATAPRKAGGPFGAVDLPVVEASSPFGAVDLPSAAPRQGGGFGVPPAPPRDLPSVSHGGLPAVGGGLPVAPAAQPQPMFPPSPGQGSHGHGPQGAPDLPTYGGPGLPAATGAGLPSFGGGPGLPTPAGAGLPTFGGPAAGLPSPGGAGLPTPGGGGLPMFGGQGAGLPTVGGGLPVAATAGLPTPGGSAALPSPMGMGALPSPGGPGFPMAAHGGGGLPMPAMTGGLPTPAPGGVVFGGFGGGGGYPSIGQGTAGVPASTGNEFDGDFGGGGAPPPPPYTENDEYDPMAGAAGFGGGGGAPLAGGELDLDAAGIPAPAAGGGGPTAAPIPVARSGAREDDRPVRKRSRAPKIILAGLVVAALGGALLGLTKLGPFGSYAISDSLNATSNQEALLELRKNNTELLAGDTVSGATKAIGAAKQRIAGAPRHADTRAYAAYLMYLKSIRYGQDGGSEAAGAAILDAIPPETKSDLVTLARGARDAASGELARAKQTLTTLATTDLGAAVLTGEIELLSRTDKATAAWDRAVKMEKSPRTLFGLARAQFAAGKTKEAEVTAKTVLETAPKHVAARNLLARIALADPARDTEVIGLLTKVLDDKDVRAEASDAELVTAYSLTGLAHLENSRISQAEQAFQQALKMDPQAVEALLGNGELFYRQGLYSKSQARFEAAASADADSLPARIGLAKVHIRSERAKEAKDHLIKLREAHGKDPRVAHWLGKAEESLGNRKEAQALYTEAIKLAGKDPIAVDSYVALSSLLAALGLTEEAAKKLEEASKEFPELPALYRARGDVALQSGRYDKAKQEYEIALKKREDVGTRFQLGIVLRRMRLFDEAAAVFDQVAAVDKDYPNLALERGLYFQDTGQTDQALAMYGEALKKAPGDIDLKLRVASTQVDGGQPDKAEQALKEVLKERPSSAEANHYYGRVLLAKAQNFSEAMNYLQKAVQYDPNRPEYHLYVAIAANEAGQTGRAEEAITKALQLDVEMADAYWQRGVLKQKAGATLDAIADLTKALDKKPSRYEAYASLALCYSDQNDIASAENAWRYALRGNPNVPEWRFKLGSLLAKRKNDWPGAVEQMTKAVELGQDRNPRPPWLFQAHYLLAEGLDKANDKDKAITHYRRYLELAPSNDPFRVEADAAVRRLGGGG